MPKYKDVDRGWAWVVAFASFGSNMLNGTFVYGAGIIHVALLRHFGGDVAFTSLIGSVFTSVLSIMSPLASILINTGSCRIAHMTGGFLAFTGFSLSFFVHKLEVFLLTYGILAGTGLSFCLLPSLCSLGFSFEKYRGTSIGIAVAGAGCGMFLSGPVIQFIVDTYGLHGTFLLMGGVATHQIFLGSLMKPSSIELKHKKSKQQKIHERRSWIADCRKSLQLEVFKNKTYLFVTLGMFLWNTPYSSILLHLPNISIMHGFNENNAALLLTYVGLGSAINRVLTGLSLGPGGLDPLLLYFGFLGISALLTLLFPVFSAPYVGQCIFSFIFGIYSGGLIALLTPLMVDLVGLSQLSTALGVNYFIGGVGYIIGPPIVGAIVDNGGTYEHSFYFSGVCFVLATFSTLLSVIWRQECQEPVPIEKEISFHDIKSSGLFKGSGFLAGSGLLGGSMILTININAEDEEKSLSEINSQTRQTCKHLSSASLAISNAEQEILPLQNGHSGFD